MRCYRKFEAYLVNLTYDLNSPYIMRHFEEVDTACLSWERAYILSYILCGM